MYGDISAKAANKLAQPEVIYLLFTIVQLTIHPLIRDMNLINFSFLLPLFPFLSFEFMNEFRC